ncbi:DsrE family protein [Sulfurovum sp. XTW-4]|uniref:DsrE family protein n=1 Tax=Sulfurovum xiamenensis TaxID=3019066 RepID=A0ABT7QSW2_9BACT|nr:DsrE family protein [Sulfurovum xiamenensis]MDM5264175.1 DsrE family protein [Sulfurovum xiamenensis]
MKKILILLACVLSFTVAETEFAEPKPAIDNPRQLVFGIPSGDVKEINRILSTVNNVMKFYRPENTEVVIVAYGQGLKSLLKKGDADVRKRIEALMTYDVEFIACGNTMRTLHIEKKDLLDDIGFATAGIVEIIERQLRGYTYAQP